MYTYTQRDRAIIVRLFRRGLDATTWFWPVLERRCNGTNSARFNRALRIKIGLIYLQGNVSK